MAAPAGQGIVGLQTLTAGCATPAGVGGSVHDVEQLIRGGVSPPTIMVGGRMHGPIAWHLGGEPAMAVITGLPTPGAPRPRR